MSETVRYLRDNRSVPRRPCDRCGSLQRVDNLKDGLCGGCTLTTRVPACATCGDLDDECPDCTEPVA